VLDNIISAEDLRGVAARKAKYESFKSVRNSLVQDEIACGWRVHKANATTTRLSRSKSHDKLLEDRVWTLLYRMGFTFLSADGGAFLLLNKNEPKGPDNQIDVVAIDDEVAFAIECKSSEKPRRFTDFSAELAKHVSLRDRFTKAVREQFSVADEGPVKRPSIFAIWTTGIIVADNDRVRAEHERVPLLDEKDLEYYEQLVSQVGSAARFQFLADLLQGRVIPGLEIKVPAIRSKMAGSLAYTFSVSPEYLLKICFVSHRARGKASDIDAYQRLLKRSRLKSIRQYIDEGGIFPTNIVVNIAESRWLQFERAKQESETKSSTFGWLHIRPAYRIAWIIDGQHRLFAYANHALARKSLVSVMAFVGLEASEQARLFVDINARQRKVKQSLLQELYAELHWDAEEPGVRVQAILSKVVQSLDTDLDSPFYGRILKADDSRTETRCISLTSLFGALDKASFFISRMRKGGVPEFGPLWRAKNEATVKRTVAVIGGYFNIIRGEASDVWNRGSGENGGLSMNDGITVCTNLLRSIFSHLESVKRIHLADLGDEEIVEAITPLSKHVGQYFASMSVEQMLLFRALRGVQGQTAGTRRLEQAVNRSDSSFDPPGLKDFLEREKAQTTTRAYEQIKSIEHILQATVIGELKNEFGADGEEWWFAGVPKQIRKKVDDRRNEEAGKTGEREQNFDLIDYRPIILDNWELFEGTLARGKGNKDTRTKWIVEVNELRKPVMHASRGQSLPITEEQVAFLEEIQGWLRTQVEEQSQASGDA
jgi:DNA sulfur modification protein DndB